MWYTSASPSDGQACIIHSEGEIFVIRDEDCIIYVCNARIHGLSVWQGELSGAAAARELR